MNDTRLYLRLPHTLKQSSQDTAKAINMDYSTFVRQAIEEKIERVKPPIKHQTMNRTYRIETYTHPIHGRTELTNLCDKRAKVGGMFCLRMCSCKIKVEGEYVICKKPIDKIEE